MDRKGGARKTVGVDFDGVLHSYKSGWQGADVIPDPPIPGAIEWLEGLVDSSRFVVAITSARSSQNGGINAMRTWLLEHGMEPGLLSELWFPTEKPPAHLTIDDRVWRFDGTYFPSPDTIDEFEPWWRG